MLVQKTGLNKRTKILLIIFAGLLLPAGYFVYSTYLAKPADTTPIADLSNNSYVQPVVVTPLDNRLLDDAQVRSFTGIDVPGFVEQQAGIYLDDQTPLPPSNISVTNPATGGRLVVSWELPAARNFDSVKLYRSDVPGVKGESIYTVAVDGTVSVMNFEDTGLVNQHTYFYLAVTVNAEGRESQNVQQFAGTPVDTFPPSAPSAVTVNNMENDRVEISWLVPPDPDFSTVRIYRSNQQGTLGSVIPLTVTDGDGNQQSAIDTVTPNVAYYYTVTSVDTSGNESSTDILAAPYRANPFQPVGY
ncbi:MAG: hypothetical protein WC544_04665 [Patescibacteria group bacterium]